MSFGLAESKLNSTYLEHGSGSVLTAIYYRELMPNVTKVIFLVNACI